jgi:single-stranded DNA-binding protein
MQKIMIIGFVGHDVERRRTSGGLHVTQFSVGVKAGDKSVWYDIVIWGDKVDGFGIINNIKKGSNVCIFGDLMAPKPYTNKNGEVVIKLKISPLSINFTPTKEKKEAEVEVEVDGSQLEINNNYLF